MAALAAHFKQMAVCLILSGGPSIQFYVLLVYMPTFASTQLHLPLGTALVAQSVGLIFLVVLVPLFGVLADHIGRRKPIMDSNAVNVGEPIEVQPLGGGFRRVEGPQVSGPGCTEEFVPPLHLGDEVFQLRLRAVLVDHDAASDVR